MNSRSAAAWFLALSGMLLAAAPTLSDKVEKVAMKELDTYRQCAAAALLSPPQRQQIDAAVASAKEATHAIREDLDSGKITADKASEQMSGIAGDLLLKISTTLDARQFTTFRQRIDAAPRIKLAHIDARLLNGIKSSLDAVGLSDAQKQQADRVFTNFQSQFDANYMQYLDGKLSELAWQAEGSAMTRQLVDDCVALLEPPQKATWALLMAGDFAAPRVRRSLDQFKLSPQQTSKVDALFQTFKTSYDALRADFAAKKIDAPQFKQQAQDLLRKLITDSRELLTPAQQQAWDDAANRARQ